MKKSRLLGTVYACVLCVTLTLSSVAHSAPITLDFTSGIYSNTQGASSDTYTQDGFILTTESAGNHMDPGFIGTLGFHNGAANPTTDNNLILTYSGGAFDLTSIDFAGLSNFGISLDLLASNGATESITTIGLNSLSFFNVTSVVFSIAESEGEIGSAGWNSFVVNAAVPIPAALWLFGSGLLGLIGIARRKKA